MTIDDIDAVEAALAVLRQNGIDISSPRDGDLDDLEQERFNAVADACRAYASRRSSPAREQVTEATEKPALVQYEFEDGSIDHYSGIFGTIQEVNGKKVVRATPLYTRFSPSPTGGEAGAVAAIVPDHCTGSALAFSEGALYVSKDGSGYIAVDEEHWTLEDDRAEGVDGPEGSVHWITHLAPSEMEALRDFLNGSPRAALTRPAPLMDEVEAVAKSLQQMFPTLALSDAEALIFARALLTKLQEGE